MPKDSSASPRPGLKLSGRYRLEMHVSSGGMATVWRARDDVLDRVVAAKILHEHLGANEQFRERFRIEAVAAARLSHPNIVSVFDTGTHEGSPFIVMEYLAGGTLQNLMAENAAIDPVWAAGLGADVCKALEHAHSAGVIHRDIKPANILFSETRRVKVGDFGIAKAAFAPSDLTDTGAVLGTVRYLAPEQVEGIEPDGRADIYSLGVVLYEMVTGRPPFSAEGQLAAATSRIGRSPTPPRDLSPGIPRALDAAIMKSLSPDRSERFPDATSFERALRTVSGHNEETAVVSLPPPPASHPTAEHSFVRTEASWLIPTVVIIMLTAGLVLGVPALRNRLTGAISSAPARTAQAPSPLQVSAERTYDPAPGDGSENDSDAPAAFDHNPATSWRTSNYKSADLGGLKDGVGIFFDLGTSRQLKEIKVSSVVGGWSGAIRTSDDGSTWSQNFRAETAGVQHTFEARGTHRYWMLWITRLAPNPDQGSSQNPYSVGIAEVAPVPG